jgi:hypothetical protein
VIRSGDLEFWGKMVPLGLALALEFLFVVVLVAR